MIELLGAVMIAILAAFGLGRWRGGRAAREKAAAAQAKAVEQRRERIQDAQDDLSDDIGLLRDSLRAREPGLK